ncbi:isopentenyl-diphosphate delta-isomerase, type 1 family protein [Trichomonas vaginalis G3]|uniref:isopentenyl-diphosphate Delta-isomerase n=1 Tax=Trichomonas vaginalis (strain ATCC PRA-98 / G3) TaxID=412133 RepID=A2EXQ9_TRIV3|nr:isopentenyl-diphosphate delta-isomerase protein [Trichomonas vaginalis G3]EAY02569.1 isopentenyl-diphosphate delta-isomerase, type 1 family protein [Trichomonas vaginalis G3]KAI5552040.1 isopentenyl-diphosphate delta-isomerase protein [Trichomonas vaginalis G3]|eukprot:XP_001330705.1 isopentenyl-diphosphate delta-isomerase, type 1 family protein [Trichomonas vaginalis G3]
MSVEQQNQMQNAHVVLVDKDDNPVGEADKYTAHRTEKGPLLHRAFSLFLFDSERRLLLQQRSSNKITFPLIWANTCCSHPEPKEAVLDAAVRRVDLELNIKLSSDAHLQELGSFVYKAIYEDGWAEYELDHVVFGYYDVKEINPNPEEVQAVRWVTQAEFEQWLNEKPQELSPWIKKIWTQFLQKNWNKWCENKNIPESEISLKPFDLE